MHDKRNWLRQYDFHFTRPLKWFSTNAALFAYYWKTVRQDINRLSINQQSQFYGWCMVTGDGPGNTGTTADGPYGSTEPECYHWFIIDRCRLIPESYESKWSVVYKSTSNQ